MELKSIKYRIYPNKNQKILLEKHFGCTRLIYNLALQCKQLNYSGNKHYTTYNQISSTLPELKNDNPWLKEINSQSIQASLKNLEKAYFAFFNKRSGFPKYKKKTSKQTFQVPQNVKIKANKVSIPKFKEGIKAVIHKQLDPTLTILKQATITRTSTNKYFVSISYKDLSPIPSLPTTSINTIGIDVGINRLAVLSNGTEISNPKILKKHLNKIKYLSRILSKKKKGSKNRNKARYKLAKAHEKVKNQRLDHLHKSTYKLANDNQVCTYKVEDLQVSNMLQNHKLAQAISDVSWYEFIRQLEYKLAWRNKQLIKVAPNYTSMVCSNCSNINHDLTLKDRIWTCSSCNTTHDRDINAAINIKNKRHKDKRGRFVHVKPVELPSRSNETGSL